MTILCYHSVDPAWDSPLAMRPDEFAAHCDWLARKRTVVPLAYGMQRIDASGRLPRGMAVLTFDDGFTGVLEHALPAIKRYRMPVTVFLVAQTLTQDNPPVDWVRTPPAWPLTTLTVEQVLELQDEGVDFQSHSWAHRDLPELSYVDCVEDLRHSRELLEDLLGSRVPYLAYPRGRHDADVRRAAEDAGYKCAFTLPETRESLGPYAIPRVGIHRGNSVSVLAAKSARSYLTIRNGHAGMALRTARQRIGRRHNTPRSGDER